MSKTTLAAAMKIIEALAPAADAGGRSSDIVSLKNAGRANILVSIAQGNAAPVALAVMQATDVSGAGAKALGNAGRIWSNADTSLSDTLVRQPDGVGFTTSAALKNKQVLFEVDATLLDVEGGYDCVFVTTGASNAANITAAIFLLDDLRYQQETPPSGLVD
ncbi:hypothetical protein [Hansschlegelia plantiphila]|uniref:Uncharacterized protein n=1 Tax=Hansschlegelia plantiphila TaxID=374655 RepID=A0A9W6MU43_9HYPH|nr:hypothetical protein [Hansschlegelia plantiphila]GLK67014.1 hypothetical protein GCM10008179_06520 [Hansschlegelia plantiphila]